MSKSTPPSKAGPASAQTGIFSGIKNPSGIAIVSFVGIFTAFVPITTRLARTSFVGDSIGLALRLIPGSSAIPKDRVIVGLAAIYVFSTMAVYGPLSVAGQAMGKEGAFDNNSPRKHRASLTGLPLRLYSAHMNILENFPLWGLAAAMTQVLDPTNTTAVNLLGLAALTKLFIYYPAYIFNISPLRSICHAVHTAATANVLWKLATNFK